MDKAFIISEIHRTARENNGKALGMQKFKAATGIGKNEWFKYWRVWSDALQEAGYQPNTWTQAYDEEFLICSYITLIQELGKFPTTDDLKIKKRTNMNFPSHSTFENLGNKNGKLGKILKYCENRDEYNSVVEICKPLLKYDLQERDSDQNDNASRFGFVYLMKSGKYYKIGRSNYPEKRNYEIGLQLPEELNIIHKIQTDDPVGIEDYWHNRFKEKRKKGEWFELSNVDIKVFKRRRFM